MNIVIGFQLMAVSRALRSKKYDFWMDFPEVSDSQISQPDDTDQLPATILNKIPGVIWRH